MSPIASNDTELAAMLSEPVMRGLKIMGEQFLEPRIEQIINTHTNRGVIYAAGQGGSLSRAWTTKTSVGAGGSGLGIMETYYDSSKLTYNASVGQHETPSLDNDELGNYRHIYSVDRITDMASLIDKGLGGMLFGPDNPTRVPTGFWDFGVIPQFKANQRPWIVAGLTAAGLTVM